MAFFDELKRRKVFRVTSLYAVTAWGASMGAAELFPTFGLPDQSVRWFVTVAFALLPVVALLAWLFEVTPRGIERDQGIAGANSDSATRVATQRNAGTMIARWQGQQWTFKQSFTIGRDDDCEMNIDDPKISRRHARVVAQHGKWYVEDLGSSNGTSVNGELVSRVELSGPAAITLYDGASNILLTSGTSGGATTLLADAPQPGA